MDRERVDKDKPLRCKSGKHVWLDQDSREKCCNGYKRLWTPNASEAETVRRDGLGGYYWWKESDS